MKFSPYIKNRLSGTLKGLGAIGAACVMLFALPSCSDKDLDDPDTSGSGEAQALYFSISVSTPADNSTRSFTETDGGSNSGTQEGLTNESKITKAHVFFFDEKTGEKLLSFTADESATDNNSELKAFGSNVTEIYAKIDIKNTTVLGDLKKLLSAEKANVYVIANADPANLNTIANEASLQGVTFSGSTANFVRSFTIGTGTTSTSGMVCPMSNKDMFPIILPHKTFSGSDNNDVIKAALELFTGSYRTPAGDPAHLWNISETHGFLPLERAVARVDYLNNAKTRFDLVDALGPDYEDVELELIGMQLFNISQSAFMFRHTSDGDLENGTRTGVTPKIFGNENGYNDHSAEGSLYRWIYDCDWEDKIDDNINKNDGLNGLTIKNNTSYFINQSTVTTTGTGDNAVSTWSVGGTDAYTSYSDLKEKNSSFATSNRGYLPWHYVMENTLPSTSMMGIPFSTGVAFKVKLHLYKTTVTPPAEEEGEPTVTREEVNYTSDKCPKVMMKSGYYQYPQWQEDENEPEGGYWYYTYRYLIEHNNENDGTVSGNTGVEGTLAPMHIGIVRNNIYQLNINSISNLPQPHEPDNLYMAVSIHILDWVKRQQSYDL